MAVQSFRHRTPTLPANAAVDARLRILGAESERRSRLNLVLPWVISLGIHTLAIVVAMLVTWAVFVIRGTPEATLVVADFRAPALSPLVAEPRESGDAGSLSDALLELESPPTPQDSPTLLPELPGSVAPPVPATSTLLPPDLGEAATFAGLRANNARKIVYVVDASGSMVGTLGIILDELSRSIRALEPSQSFAVIFFQRNQAVPVPPGDRLVPALPDERERAIRWMRNRIVPTGRSNPLRAIELAIRLRPDVIFLLGHEITGSGQFEIDQRDLLAALDRLNPVRRGTGARAVSIKCIQFLDPDPLDTLRRIAEAHGGPDGYRYLDRTELGIAPR